MKAYLAAPLFGLAEKEFNRALATAIRERVSGLAILLPQEACSSIAADEHRSRKIFRKCLDGIDACDWVIAVLDGPDADSGTSLEIGYAYATGKPIIGIRTDFRGSEDRGLNLMLSNACDELILATEDSVATVAARVAEFIERALAPTPEAG